MADEEKAQRNAEEYRVRTVKISKLEKQIDQSRNCHRAMIDALEAANMADLILKSLREVRPHTSACDDSLTSTRENMRRISDKFQWQFREIVLNYEELKAKLDKGYDDNLAHQLWWDIYRTATTDYFQVLIENRDNFISEILKGKTESIFEKTVCIKMQNELKKLIDDFKATEQLLIYTEGAIRGDVTESNPAVYEDHLLVLKSDMLSAFEKYKGFYRLLFPASQDSETEVKEKAIYGLYLLPVEAKSEYYNELLRCREEFSLETKRLMEQLFLFS